MTDDLVQRLRRTYRKEYAPTGSTVGDISNRLRPFPILATEVLFNPDGLAAAERIEQLEREKAVVSDLWEQQKEIALDYLTDCNKAAERIEALIASNEQWQINYNEGVLDNLQLQVDNARLREHLISALDTLKDAEVCDDNCGPCNESRAALEKST